MISVDTSVVVRYLVGTPAAAARADALVAATTRASGATPLYSFDRDMARLGVAVVRP